MHFNGLNSLKTISLVYNPFKEVEQINLNGLTSLKFVFIDNDKVIQMNA
jgi:hypothetical protein